MTFSYATWRLRNMQYSAFRHMTCRKPFSWRLSTTTRSACRLAVQEKEQAKAFPEEFILSIDRNDSSFMHVRIGNGADRCCSLGLADGPRFPESGFSPGGRSMVTSGHADHSALTTLLKLGSELTWPGRSKSLTREATANRNDVALASIRSITRS